MEKDSQSLKKSTNIGENMSVKDHKLEALGVRIRHHHRMAESSPPKSRARALSRIRSALALVHYEWVKNDVTIRAESLSYYTLFSFMPLLAGVFLVLGFFSQWGPIQQEFQDSLGRLFGALPEDQRKTLLQFMVQFKDQYLANLGKKSGSIGIFAIGVLLWIGAKVFFNIESLMNRIWQVREERPLLERVKNFFFTMVLLPLLYAAALSLPRIFEWISGAKIHPLLEQGVFDGLVFFSFAFVLKLFPYTRVSWRAAGAGAGAGTLGFVLAQTLLRAYFRMGMETAYGKAAVLPLFAFFIYVTWLLIILSVEVSFLVEKGWRWGLTPLPDASLSGALVLDRTLRELGRRFESGELPVTLGDLCRGLSVPPASLEPVLHFLMEREVVLRGARRSARGGDSFALCKSVTEADLVSLIKDFLELERLAQKFDVPGLISRIK